MRQQKRGSSQHQQCNHNKTNGLCLPTGPSFFHFNPSLWPVRFQVLLFLVLLIGEVAILPLKHPSQ